MTTDPPPREHLPGASGATSSQSGHPGESSPLIEIEDLAKSFVTRSGEVVTALEGLNITVRNKEFVAIVGPSGCGKTTLLRILGGLIPYERGRVLVNGHSVQGPGGDVGMMFQAPVLLPWRRVIDNVLVPIDIKKKPRRLFEQRATELLTSVDLAHVSQMYPQELSGGMQQRVAICRALINDPALLLMDEPFGALDALTREQMNLELQRIWLASQKTVVLITHSIPEAVFLADRVLVMASKPGRVAKEIPLQSPRPRTLKFLDTEQYLSAVSTIRSEIMSQGAID